MMMQDPSLVAILASVAAISQVAHASPWVPVLEIRAGPADGAEGKAEPTSDEEEPTTTTKKAAETTTTKHEATTTTKAETTTTSKAAPETTTTRSSTSTTTTAAKTTATTTTASATKTGSITSSDISSPKGIMSVDPASTMSSVSHSATESSSFVDASNKAVDDKSSGVSSGAVAGIVVAVIAGVAAIAGFVMIRKRKARRDRSRALAKDPFNQGFGSHDPPAQPHAMYDMSEPSMIQMPPLGASAVAGAAVGGGYAAYNNSGHEDGLYRDQLQDNSYNYQHQQQQPPMSPYNQYQQADQSHQYYTPQVVNNPYGDHQYNTMPTSPQPGYDQYQQQYNNGGYDQSNDNNNYGNNNQSYDYQANTSPVAAPAVTISPSGDAGTAGALAGAGAGIGAAGAAGAAAGVAAGAVYATADEPSGNSIGVFNVISTYTPTLSDELEIHTGDRVEIFVEYDDGWCQGVNLSRGNTKGVFPRHCADNGSNNLGTVSNAPVGHTEKRVSSMYIQNPM